MKHYQIKILRSGDTVLSVQDCQIAVRRANGEVDIIRFSFDENGLPRIDMNQMTTITFGDNMIEVIESSQVEHTEPHETSSFSKKPRSKTRAKKDHETIVGTF